MDSFATKATHILPRHTRASKSTVFFQSVLKLLKNFLKLTSNHRLCGLCLSSQTHASTPLSEAKSQEFYNLFILWLLVQLVTSDWSPTGIMKLIVSSHINQPEFSSSVTLTCFSFDCFMLLLFSLIQHDI